MVISDAIDGSLLREIQEAWTRVVAPIQKQWEKDIKQGEGIDGLFFQKPPASSIAAPTTRGSVLYRTFCETQHLPCIPVLRMLGFVDSRGACVLVDIPNFLEQDDVFLNLIDRPKVLANHPRTCFNTAQH